MGSLALFKGENTAKRLSAQAPAATSPSVPHLWAALTVPVDACHQGHLRPDPACTHTHTGPSGSHMVGEAPLELEKVDEVLWGHGQEAAVGVSGRARVSRVLQEEGTGITPVVHQLFGKWPPDPISKGHGK